jgi:hypothetical protein
VRRGVVIQGKFPLVNGEGISIGLKVYDVGKVLSGEELSTVIGESRNFAG